MDCRFGAALEERYVDFVYRQMADTISEYKSRPWPKVKDFLFSLPPGSLVIDMGCGEGRYLGLNADVISVGVDKCIELGEISKTRGFETVAADNLSVPFRANTFDAAISIGVIHHFSTNERRIKALQEIARVTRSEGRIMIYVWALEQRNRRFESQDLLVPWNFYPVPKRSLGSMRSTPSGSFSEDETLPTYPVPQERRFSEHFFNKLEKIVRRIEREFSPSKSEDGNGTNKSALSGPNEIILRKPRHPLLEKAHSSPNCRPRSRTGGCTRMSSLQNEERVPEGGASPRSSRRHNRSITQPACSGFRVRQFPASSRPPSSESSFDRDDDVFDNDASVLSESTLTDALSKHDSNSDSFLRFYHVFRKGELVELIDQNVPSIKVLAEIYDHSNWCVIAQKI